MNFALRGQNVTKATVIVKNVHILIISLEFKVMNETVKLKSQYLNKVLIIIVG